MISPSALTTASGRLVDLLSPRGADVDFAVVAEHLAKENRYNGATPEACYGVAEHSVRCADAALAQGYGHLAAAYCLLHDGHEAYLKDDTTPKKRALAALAAKHFGVLAHHIEATFALLTAQWDAAIHEAAGLAWPPPADIADIVHAIDRQLLATEWRDLMPTPPPFAPGELAPLPEMILPWHWTRAREEFLQRCAELIPAFDASTSSRTKRLDDNVEEGGS